ncbi:hypothetical protein N665_0532s0018 [Sinapis alba]|nr:hypothetical protein N665_0532s0018 [Sinapis alba]
MRSSDSVQTSGKSGEITNLMTQLSSERSPAEGNVFASSFVDETVAVWDVRVGKSHALAFKAKKYVNVISWHRFFCQGTLKTDMDLSLEKDEEEAEFKAYTKEQLNNFFPRKSGTRKDLKELHWHNQIPGMIISTASDGFNSFHALQHVEHPS